MLLATNDGKLLVSDLSIQELKNKMAELKIPSTAFKLRYGLGTKRPRCIVPDEFVAAVQNDSDVRKTSQHDVWYATRACAWEEDKAKRDALIKRDYR